MPPKSSNAERLLVLTFMLEAAVESEDWAEVSHVLDARQELIDELDLIPPKTIREIGVIEERVLTTMRRRLVGVRADMRNLTAALRTANSYVHARRPASLSLAG